MEGKFVTGSYVAHAEHWKRYSSKGEMSAHARTWLSRDTVDYWRHHRMLQTIAPLVETFKNSRWVTIGDGRFGTEAHFLRSFGLDATATDIGDELLVEALAEGFIDKFSKENAERLSFQDESFDFAFCKESYHHFPRPYIALYEMLRVARTAVVLIEPKDGQIHFSFVSMLFEGLRNLLKKILGKPVRLHDFEDVGNYIYSISEREIEKVALGMNLRHVAFLTLQDAYLPGVEYAKAVPTNPLFRRIRRKIRIESALSRIGVRNSGLLVAIIFKKDPGSELIRELRRHGYVYKELPRNPFAS